MCCDHCAPETMKAIREGKTFTYRTRPAQAPESRCTCMQPWNGVTNPPACPSHGQRTLFRIVC